MTTQCPWKIRPFPNPTEIQCAKQDHLDPEFPSVTGDNRHEGMVLDYAYPGSVTHICWFSGDRREYQGAWPGFCGDGPGGCVLPAGHQGRCAP